MTGRAGVLAVGANSFFARCWSAGAYARANVRFVSHQAIGDDALLAGIHTVVSFVRPDDYDRRELAPNEDANTRLAQWLAPSERRLVILSSRQVYGDAASPFREEQRPEPRTVGARNRLATESRVAQAMGERVTILRCANLFGFELQPGRTRFMATMLRGLLQDGHITLNVSGLTRRDFLPDQAVARALDRVAAAPVAGVLNLGSGVGTPLAELAGAVIRGFGSGEFIELSDKMRDAFVLDMSRWQRHYGAPCQAAAVLQRAEDIGRKLRDCR